MTTYASSANIAQEQRARRRWVGLILALFVSQIGLWVYAIIRVASDPSHAVLPSYDTRALNWDAEVHAQQQSDALGWSLTATTSDANTLIWTLRDASQEPVAHAAVTMRYFHRARAATVLTEQLITNEQGVATMALPPLAGLWQFECTVQRSSDRYVTTVVHRVNAATPVRTIAL